VGLELYRWRVNNARPLRVSIIDDFEVVQLGLSQMLAPYDDRVEVVDAAENPGADIALYDTHFSDEPVAGVAERCGATRVVVYSWDVDRHDVEGTVLKGADGYLSKRLPALELVTALERIHAGETVVSGAVVAGTAQGDWLGKDQGLSQRESEIIALIAQGLSNQDVARKAFLSINTVKSYIRTAYRTMGVDSRSQAVLWGVQHGFRPDSVRLRFPVA
jgi:DNA-binding NarL/FixJ family response regulator